MGRTNYAIHGWKHRTGGEDPIPGLGGTVTSGIQFTNSDATYGTANSGRALSIQTTGTLSGVSGYGVNFDTNSGGFQVDANGNIKLSADFLGGGAVTIETLSAADITVRAWGGDLTLRSGDAMSLLCGTGALITSVAGTSATTQVAWQARIGHSGDSFAVMDNTPIRAFEVIPQAGTVVKAFNSGGTVIFQVTNAGTLHLKSGGTIVFDL